MLGLKNALVTVTAAVLSIAGLARAEVACTEPVQTGSGQVRGMKAAGTPTCAWKGIPYAAPPVGRLRWQSPQPAPAWSGAREMTRFGHRCMQNGIMAMENLTGKEGMSEDCLYLNVWRPQKPGVFPVMVWVHGGGYYGGAASTPMYWGDRLAAAGDLVVVSINYRVNIFGFFALPALREEDPHRSTGGQGTLDQVAALRWVHDNIRNFGGDPDQVTIFGESAGGWSICTLLATPLTEGLVQGAILESGGCEQSRDLETGYRFAQDLAPKLGCKPDDLNCLRNVSAKKVLDRGVEGGMGHLEFMPHHDGYLLTGTPLAMIRSGNFRRVPFLAGSNRDEFGNMLKLKRQLRRVPPDQFEAKLKEEFNTSDDEARALMSLYPLAEFQNRPVNAYGRMFGADMALICPTYAGLLAAARHQPDTYYYHFEYDEMKFGKFLGAAHALELPFIFDSFDRPPMSMLYNRKNLPEAKALSKIIQGYWINFAKTGNPNQAGLPEWPKFDPSSQKVQVLDTTVQTEPAGMAEKCEFWGNFSKNHPRGEAMLGRKK
jgi:para-nitrobenzyl esterase